MPHDRQRDQQGLQVEGFAGGVVLGEIHERLIGAPGERRIGMANERQSRCTPRLAVLERSDALLRRPGKRRYDDDRLRPQAWMPCEYQFGRQAQERWELRSGGEYLLRRAHQDDRPAWA